MKSFFRILIISLCFFSFAYAAEKDICPDGSQKLMSPDKSWFACPVSIDGKSTFSINGKPGTPYDWTGFPDFSPDSKRLAYKARIGNEWFVVTGERNGEQKKGKSYSEIEAVIWDLAKPVIKFSVFGPQGTLAYAARQDDKWFIVSNNHESPAYDWSRPIIFSPDGSKFGYKVKLGDKWSVVINNKEGKAYDWVSIPMFSPDSKRFAYKARLGNEWFIVVGDKAEKSYDDVSFPTWSPDSKKIAYQAKEDGMWFVVVNGEQGKVYKKIVSLSDNNDYRDFGVLTFTSDSKDIQYTALVGGTWRIITGENEREEYVPSKESEIVTQSVPKASQISDIEKFRAINGQFRSLASRIETRLDKVDEKRGFEDSRLREDLADARLSIHKSEEAVLGADLSSAKEYMISIKNKLLSIIYEIK